MYLTCIRFLIDTICPALPWSSSRPPANHLLTIDTLHQSSSIHNYTKVPILLYIYVARCQFPKLNWKVGKGKGKYSTGPDVSYYICRQNSWDSLGWAARSMFTLLRIASYVCSKPWTTQAHAAWSVGLCPQVGGSTEKHGVVQVTYTVTAVQIINPRCTCAAGLQ